MSISSIVKRSHVSIWKWLHSEILFFLADNNRLRTDRHPIKKMFVDETLVRIDRRDYWIWVAYERNLDVCLIMHLSSVLFAAPEPLRLPKKQRHDGVAGRDSSSALVIIMDGRDDESTYNIQY